MEHNHLPPAKIAFIIDDEVVDIIATDERLAAVFLSEPTIVDVSDLKVQIGSKYDPNTKEFTPPAE